MSLFISFVMIALIIFSKRYHYSRVLGVAFLVGTITFYLTFPARNNKILQQSNSGNWTEHLLSVTNLQNNVSNLERMNRYRCAYRMFLDRPFFGFGAGTYPNAFIPFQKPEEMTRISVTNKGPHPPGRGGSAHSEYLRALSESGLPGLLIFLGLILISCKTGIRIFFKSKIFNHRIYALGILFGLLTFFIHGIFNNFLHQGKLAVLFWSLLMVLVNLAQSENKNI